MAWWQVRPKSPTSVGSVTETTSTGTITSHTGWTVSSHFPPAEINGVDLAVLMELAKLAKGLNLKTVEEVRKHFGEFYGEAYATTTIKYGGLKLK